MWQGFSNLNDHARFFGTLSQKQPAEILAFPSPPLGARGAALFDEDRANIFDQVFFKKYDEVEILGSEDVHGLPTVVVELRLGSTAAEMECTRAWIGIEQGFLPVRWELSRLDRSVERMDRRFGPFEILTVSEVRKIGDNSFYPISWTIESRQDDDREPRGPSPNDYRPLYTYQHESLNIESISSIVAEPVPLSQLGFPKGTYCFDETKNEYFTVGAAEAAVDAAIQSTPKVISSPPATIPPVVDKPLRISSPGRWRFLVANGLVIAGLIVFAVVRWFRASRQDRGVK